VIVTGKYRYLIRLRGLSDPWLAGDQCGYQEERMGGELPETPPVLAAANPARAGPTTSQSGEGPAIPYGIYDWPQRGLRGRGTSHDTPTFAVAAIRRWWWQAGGTLHGGPKRLRSKPTAAVPTTTASGGGRWRCKPGRRDRTGHHRDSLPTRSVEVESDRPPDVQPDQRQLGRGSPLTATSGC